MLHFPLFFFQLNGSRILYKNILYFCCGPIFLFLPCSVFLFSSQQCFSRIWRLTFSHKWLKSCWIPRSPSLGPPSGCRGEGIGGRRSPSCWWEGAFAGCMRLYWKRNLCCSNSFFCCSLDCQDVLNISVLWAWSFNKKKLSVQPSCLFCFVLYPFFMSNVKTGAQNSSLKEGGRGGEFQTLSSSLFMSFPTMHNNCEAMEPWTICKLSKPIYNFRVRYKCCFSA